MKRLLFTALGLSMLSLFVACNGGTTTGGGTTADSTGKDTVPVLAPDHFEAGGLKISPLSPSPEYPDAKLSLVKPTAGAKLKPGKHLFEFKVDGFKLGEQTADAVEKGIANSDKGQHIHFILNNGPYTALYEPATEQDLTDGDYVFLAFLSRSYHESVKNAPARVLAHFQVGTPKAVLPAFDDAAPHMFYSRPKGAYKGPMETNKVMLDFYLLNCDLGTEGYKVKATINGTEFTLTKWVPYAIEGLPMGENKIKLELVDAAGATVASPYNPVERTFTLETAE